MTAPCNLLGRGQRVLGVDVQRRTDSHFARARLSPWRPLISLPLTALADAPIRVDNNFSRRSMPPVGLGADPAESSSRCLSPPWMLPSNAGST